MADFDSSLPIRTETAGDVEIKVVDGSITSRKLTVNADGSINTNTTLSATDLDIRDLVFATDKVDVSGSSVTATATDLDIRDLAFATDSVDVSGSSVTVTATNLDVRDLAFATDKVDVSGSEVSLSAGSLAALENITVSATDLDIRDLNSATDSVTVVATNLDIRDLSSATDSIAVVATDLDVRDLNSATDSVTVVATNLDVRDMTHASDSIKIGDGTDFLAVNSDGSINVVPQEDAGTERVNYNTAAAVAGGASSNHDLTFTNAAKLYQVLASASGKAKCEVQIETGSATNTFNTVAVQFNSTSTPNMDMKLSKYAAIPAGARVRVIRTNRDNQAQDLYSTIVAIES